MDELRNHFGANENDCGGLVIKCLVGTLEPDVRKPTRQLLELLQRAERWPCVSDIDDSSVLFSHYAAIVSMGKRQSVSVD